MAFVDFFKSKVFNFHHLWSVVIFGFVPVLSFDDKEGFVVSIFFTRFFLKFIVRFIYSYFGLNECLHSNW